MMAAFDRLMARSRASISRVMKEPWIGIVAAALFVAVLWLGLPHLSLGSRETSGIEAGFVGQKQLGSWTLACLSPATIVQNNTRLPAFSLERSSASPLPPPPESNSSTNEHALGRCRAVRPYFNSASARLPIMILSFRTIGAQKALVVVLRFPPLAKKGDAIVVRLAAKAFKLPVQECGNGGCLAAGALAADAERLLLSSKDSLIVFPAGPDGKKRGARIPLAGAAQALASLRQAES
jgi:hypothetical protein